MTPAETARKKLITVIPHIHFQVCSAEIQTPGCSASLAIITKNPDGSGRVTGQLGNVTEFLTDLALVLGFDSLQAVATAALDIEENETE